MLRANGDRSADNSGLRGSRLEPVKVAAVSRILAVARAAALCLALLFPVPLSYLLEASRRPDGHEKKSAVS